MSLGSSHSGNTASLVWWPLAAGRVGCDHVALPLSDRSASAFLVGLVDLTHVVDVAEERVAGGEEAPEDVVGVVVVVHVVKEVVKI